MIVIIFLLLNILQVNGVFQFPDDWNSDTFTNYHDSENQELIERFKGELRQYIFNLQPENGIITAKLSEGLGCEQFCEQKREWNRHKVQFRSAVNTVTNELINRGFSIEKLDRIEITQFDYTVTIYGNFLIIKKL